MTKKKKKKMYYFVNIGMYNYRYIGHNVQATLGLTKYVVQIALRVGIVELFTCQVKYHKVYIEKEKKENKT